MVSSVRVTDHPAGERVVVPKATPAGAWSTILTRVADSSLAAVRVKKVGCPVGNVFGAISSWAKAGAATPATTARAATTATTGTERVRISASPRGSAAGSRAGPQLELEGGGDGGRQR